MQIKTADEKGSIRKSERINMVMNAARFLDKMLTGEDLGLSEGLAPQTIFVGTGFIRYLHTFMSGVLSILRKQYEWGNCFSVLNKSSQYTVQADNAYDFC